MKIFGGGGGGGVSCLFCSNWVIIEFDVDRLLFWNLLSIMFCCVIRMISGGIDNSRMVVVRIG